MEKRPDHTSDLAGFFLSERYVVAVVGVGSENRKRHVTCGDLPFLLQPGTVLSTSHILGSIHELPFTALDVMRLPTIANVTSGEMAYEICGMISECDHQDHL